MTFDKAISYLVRHNQWRTGADDRTMEDAGIHPCVVTEAINTVALWYSAPEPYALELIRRMLSRLEDSGNYEAVCEDARRYLSYNAVGQVRKQR